MISIFTHLVGNLTVIHLYRRLVMKSENEKTSEGLNQIFEIINAKGDTGELQTIVDQNDEQSGKKSSKTK